jgi:hypothetical protein
MSAVLIIGASLWVTKKSAGEEMRLTRGASFSFHKLSRRTSQYLARQVLPCVYTPIKPALRNSECIDECMECAAVQ